MSSLRITQTRSLMRDTRTEAGEQMPAARFKNALAIACICSCCWAGGSFSVHLQGQTATVAAPAAQAGADYLVEKNVMVTMRDGVRLATDVYRPAAQGRLLPGRFPVIVYRTPYNKDGERRAGIYFAEHGYVVAAQDCRGRFASEGEFTLLGSDGPDGYDTIEWAARQPWSNGKVGTAGASYEAWTQYAAAMMQPPHLVAMFPVVGWDSFYRYALSGGVPSLSMSEWILFMAETSKEASNMPELRAKLEATFKNPDPWLRLPPQRRAEIFQTLPHYRKIFEDVYSHPDFDSYWKQQNLDLAEGYSRFKDVPMYFISGWYDGTVGGVVRNFVELSARQKTPKWLLIGPWPHATGNALCGEADFGPAAAVDEQALELDWFNHWLKAEPFRMIGSAPVKIFEMGGAGASTKGPLKAGGQWLVLPEWPDIAAHANRLYLQRGGLLSDAASGGTKSASFVDDPADPVPTEGGYLHGECVEDQAKLEKRADVLTFTTRVLKKTIAVTGTAQARIWVSSTAPDTDFVAKLVDVYPNGYAMIVAEGEIRMRFRDGAERAAPVVPGKIYPLTISMAPTSNLFAAGHRIRVDISSTDFPRLEPNPNTGAPLGKWSATAKARNTIYFDGAHPSHLTLPLMSADERKQAIEKIAP